MDDVYKTTDKRNRHSADNKEILNPTPIQPPLGYRPTLSLAEQIRLEIRQLKSLDDNEPETEEEADDFDIDEDPAPQSRWENDTVPSVKESRRKLRELEEMERRYAVPKKKEGAPAAPEPEAPAVK